MGKIKVIVKRPVNHYLIIAVYILAPLANILLIKLLGQVPFHLIFRNFFNGFGFFAGLWLITAPLVGIGFYFVNKTTWYVFIVHSTLILIDFIVKWISRPVYYLKTVPGFQNALMFSGNIILILIVGYVIQKNFRAPYFQALQRHWRESVRIPIHHVIEIDSKKMNVNDLSVGGCFVIKSDEELSTVRDHDITFKSDRLEISCSGQIMRETNDGYGIMFKNLNKVQKKDIQHFLQKRFSLRHQINVSGLWISDGISKNSTILDISKGGCFISCDLSEIQVKDSGAVAFEVNGNKFKIPSRVTWINSTGEHEKPEGFGCEFKVSHKKLIKKIIQEYGTTGLTR